MLNDQLIESFIEGVLVIGGLFNTLSDKPYPENQSQPPSPEETNTSQELPVEPPPPKSHPADTTFCQPYPPPPPLQSNYRDGEESVATPQNKILWVYLHPPGIELVFSSLGGGPLSIILCNMDGWTVYIGHVYTSSLKLCAY